MSHTDRTDALPATTPRNTTPAERSGAVEAFAVLATALAAPALPDTQEPEALLSTLAELLRRARLAATDIRDALPSHVGEALDRVSQLCVGGEPGSFYDGPPALAADVYLLRALVEMPAEAVEVLAMQAALATTELPPHESDLAVDRAIAAEQLHFAGIVPEPQRLNTARLALRNFQDRYGQAYLAHHHAYWRTAASLHAHLQETTGKARTLARLNTLTELGPPVGEAALETHKQLLQRVSPCPRDAELDSELRYEPACLSCGLRLGDEPPQDEALDTINRVDRAIHRQLARLSGAAIRPLLERGSDARIGRFLQIVQAAELSSLAEVLDDDLVGYLRRFLLETRINSLLEPVLSRVQGGEPLDGDAARATLREVARVIQRALTGGERALPPGKPEGKRASAPKPG